MERHTAACLLQSWNLGIFEGWAQEEVKNTATQLWFASNGSKNHASHKHLRGADSCSREKPPERHWSPSKAACLYWPDLLLLAWWGCTWWCHVFPRRRLACTWNTEMCEKHRPANSNTYSSRGGPSHIICQRGDEAGGVAASILWGWAENLKCENVDAPHPEYLITQSFMTAEVVRVRGKGLDASPLWAHDESTPGDIAASQLMDDVIQVI